MDSAIGLYYFGARFYDPSTFRFITRDTYGGKTDNPLSLNRYIYVKDNPLKLVDPTGHMSEDAKAANVVALALGVVLGGVLWAACVWFQIELASAAINGMAAMYEYLAQAGDKAKVSDVLFWCIFGFVSGLLGAKFLPGDLIEGGMVDSLVKNGATLLKVLNVFTAFVTIDTLQALILEHSIHHEPENNQVSSSGSWTNVPGGHY